MALPKQGQVLEHAALGMSNREIAERLRIAEQTVKNHLSSAMKKLSFHTRRQAIVMALGNRVINLQVGDESEVVDGVAR